MTHDEYVSRLETFGDSAADVQSVLEHVSECATCPNEERFAERRLRQAEVRRTRSLEPVLRGAAAMVILILMIAALRRPSDPPPTESVRYRIVGNASGVVAYTPGGMVTGTIHAPGSRRQR